jgi:hypothetical protein
LRRAALISITTLGLVAALFAGWVLVYPSSDDPKNFRYVLWNAGIYKMNLDGVTAVMTHDVYPDRLVVGKSVSELREKFGFLLDPSQTTEYYRECNQTSASKNKKVLFLRSSPWMVILDGDRATGLVLCKGY